MRCPEQSSGLLVLLLLCFPIGQTAWDRLTSHDWPAYSQPACEFKGRYLGRDGMGRPEYNYRRRCNE